MDPKLIQKFKKMAEDEGLAKNLVHPELGDLIKDGEPTETALELFKEWLDIETEV